MISELESRKHHFERTLERYENILEVAPFGILHRLGCSWKARRNLEAFIRAQGFLIFSVIQHTARPRPPAPPHPKKNCNKNSSNNYNVEILRRLRHRTRMVALQRFY